MFKALGYNENEKIIHFRKPTAFIEILLKNIVKNMKYL